MGSSGAADWALASAFVPQPKPPTVGADRSAQPDRLPSHQTAEHSAAPRERRRWLRDTGAPAHPTQSPPIRRAAAMAKAQTTRSAPKTAAKRGQNLPYFDGEHCGRGQLSLVAPGFPLYGRRESRAAICGSVRISQQAPSSTAALGIPLTSALLGSARWSTHRFRAGSADRMHHHGPCRSARFHTHVCQSSWLRNGTGGRRSATDHRDGPVYEHPSGAHKQMMRALCRHRLGWFDREADLRRLDRATDFRAQKTDKLSIKSASRCCARYSGGNTSGKRSQNVR